MTKRKNTAKFEKSPAKKAKQQSSIASFFGQPKTEPVPEEKDKEDIESVKQEGESSVKIEEEEEEIVEEKPVFYEESMYTEEFNTMLETVLEGESYLFSEEDIAIFNLFKSLQVEPKHLIVRLLMRNPRWLRRSKLRYHNIIRDIAQAAADLEAVGFLCSDLTDMKEAARLLSKNELKETLKERSITVAVDNKTCCIDALLNFASDNHANIAIHYSECTTDHSKLSKLWASIHNFLGPCIKVDTSVYKLFQRLQIVYYRINFALDNSAMSTAILARTSKRNYPVYTPCRSNAVWNSRHDLLKYEEALLVEREYEKFLEKLMAYNSNKTKKVLSAKSGDLEVRNLMIAAWTLCEDKIGLWDECIAEREAEGDQVKPYYMRRFEAGWIYTRLISHGIDILAKLHEYDLEALILQKLIDQKFYRLGKRGKWYERLALVQSKYINKDNGRTQKKLALQTCINAIHDPRVHQIYLHGIHKRINRIEKDLCIPRREQHHFDYMTLKKPKDVQIYGERLSDEIIGKKSIWRSDDGSECSVEQVALEYYKKKGFKGLHCENGIVKMIVVLLFWDIIFAPIPGVFETPYQTEPLDLRSDAFYEGRLDIIKERLATITRGEYRDIILEVYERECERRTVCTGINWNYELEDILEISGCIGSSALASLCQLFFEEYGLRSGGMPDLCCWNYETKVCLFSEVKGPGDTLSETQKLWIETLTGFDIQVEVCYVKVWKGEDVLLQVT